MDVLKELNNARGLYATCPNPICGESFPVVTASLFDATRRLPPSAASLLQEQRAALATRRKDLRQARANLSRRAFTGAATSRIGKALEMVAASLPGLPVAARDCRALLNPIDYVAFSGASRGTITSVEFIEVKTGKSPLSGIQQAVKAAVGRGAVSLRVAEHQLCIK